jgi:hypothetical protein
MRLFLSILLAALAITSSAQTTGDVQLGVKSSTGPLTPVWITKTAGKVIGWDGSGVLGPITVSGGAWGSITGTLSAQTDLQSALNAKEPTITAGTTAQFWRGDKSWQTLNAAAVGLGNVENTALSTWAGSTNLTTISPTQAITRLSALVSNGFVKTSGSNGTLSIDTSTYASLGANTFTALQTITQASANAGVISSTGYSLTGSNATSMIDLAGTWNTSGNPAALKVSITNTASGSSSRLIDLQRGTTSVFNVRPDGTTNIGDTSSTSVVFSGNYIYGAASGSTTNRPALLMAGGSGSSIMAIVGGISANDGFLVQPQGGDANTNLFGVFGSFSVRTFNISPAKKDFGGAYTGGGHTLAIAGGTASAVSTGGAGGAVNITGGAAAGGGNNNGGNVVISGGAKTGSGTAGTVSIGASGTGITQINRYSLTMVAGSVTQSSTAVTTNTLIIADRRTVGGTIGHISTSVSAGSSFTLTSSSSTETSTFTVTEIIFP